MLEAQDYPIEHFELMRQLALALKDLPAQIQDHGYSYESFGSWYVVVRCKGVYWRFGLDGKEGMFFLQRSSSRKPPHHWSGVDWGNNAPQPGASAAEIAGAFRTMAASH